MVARAEGFGGRASRRVWWSREPKGLVVARAEGFGGRASRRVWNHHRGLLARARLEASRPEIHTRRPSLMTHRDTPWRTMTHLGESPRDPHVVHEPAARRRAVEVPERAAAAAAASVVLLAAAFAVVFAAAAVVVFAAAASFAAAAAAARGVAGADREEVARHEVARVAADDGDGVRRVELVAVDQVVLGPVRELEALRDGPARERERGARQPTVPLEQRLATQRRRRTAERRMAAWMGAGEGVSRCVMVSHGATRAAPRPAASERARRHCDKNNRDVASETPRRRRTSTSRVGERARRRHRDSSRATTTPA